MAEAEDIITNKRKASTEPPEDATFIKRTKVEDGDENSGVGSELREPHNGITPIKEPGGSRTEKPPASAQETGPEPDARQSPEARRPSVAGGFPVRKSVSQEERKRGQRLFGGLLTALSRPASSSQQQKRLEIERRQQEKAQQRRAEDDKRRAEKLEKVRRARQIEQIKLDEQAMQSRHSSMLARAHSLETRSKPSLRYLPWELTKNQEETIKDQIYATQETIERERREFKARKAQRLKELGITPPSRSPSPPRQQRRPPEPEPEPEQGQEQEPDAQAEEAPVGEPKHTQQDTNPGDEARPPSKTRNYHDKDHDENGDEMVQDEEDTVIY
ncbi:hypothetical protein MFIFM68171_10698 [Madurella fahalii]|uniref:Pinin/SDK/MemA protein domain-containing protein n=1 Tax=Madurella fahalii TaxID=1157608 RepID=A0ABQ0GRX2_9PEZI